MIKRTVIAAAIAAAFAAPVHAQDDLRAELQAMKAEIQRLRDEVSELKKQQAASAPAVVAAPAAPAAPAATPGEVVITGAPAAATMKTPVAAAPAPAAEGSGLSLFGYGEASYSRPKDQSKASATVGRFVLGGGYSFDDKTKIVSELEVERAVASASDPGEVEVEQMYIEHKLTDNIATKLGLFLMPMGLLNENHEPPNYYGVNRNFVETAILPTTWRELGVGFTGNTEFGLRWDAGLTTTFDLGKWDATSPEVAESPLGAIHQEGADAKAGNLALYGALNWNGIPGLNVGGGVFGSKVGQKAPDFPSPDAKLVFYELHTRWTPGNWDLSALYAEGRFSDTEAFNLTLVGNPYPVPKRFNGWYVQGAYKAWESGNYSLFPFARYEQFNTARSYDAALAPYGYTGLPTEKVTTAGATFKLHPQVVLKADYQWFSENHERDAINLGVGFMY
jgi:hypothetical protein